MQLTLFDLWEYTEEERNQALSGKKKKSAAKSKEKNGKKQAQVTPKVTDKPAAASAVSPQTETEDEKAEDVKDVKAEDVEAKETAVQAHPDDIYADIDWEENPPINGFYETMMHLTPEVRIQLRHEAEKHRQELLAKSGMKDTLDPAFVPSSDSRPVQQADMTHGSEQAPEDESPLPEGMTATAENPSVQSGQTGTTSASLFPEYDTKPAKEEAADLTPHPYSGTVEAYHRDGSMAAEGNAVGYLRGITPYGATFHPLDLKGYQKEKALLYISIRDAYERLYRNEAENRTEDNRQREYLNVSYDEFVMRYGNLNARQNAKLLMMDASGRDVLALERAEEGKFVKADIFERPVSFSVETYVNAGSPEEALSASLNRYGGINLDFMRAITDSTEEELLGALQGRIYYNPLVSGYEIKDRFIAGK